MRFDYTTILSSAPDTGEPVVIFRPEVRITVHGPKGSGDFLALVDTGADNTILPEAIARDLGIPLTAGAGPAATVFGGQAIMLSYADVELELVHADGNLRWLARVYFVADATSQETLILGHQGFLDYFTASFDGEQCALDLEPNPYLPSITGADTKLASSTRLRPRLRPCRAIFSTSSTERYRLLHRTRSTCFPS